MKTLKVSSLNHCLSASRTTGQPLIWRGIFVMESVTPIYNGVEYPDYIMYKDGRIFSSFKQRFLRVQRQPLGYKIVTLSKDKKKKICLVHRLIAIAFIPNPDNKPNINHIDANPANNSIENLEWCTQSEIFYMHLI